MLQEPQVERSEHQDDSYIHHQPFPEPEPVPEEQDIHTDHDSCQQHYVKYDRCLSRHFKRQFKYTREDGLGPLKQSRSVEIYLRACSTGELKENGRLRPTRAWR